MRDIVLVGEQRYLVTRDPEREGELWRVRGRRWIKSRGRWAQKGQSFLCEAFTWEGPDGDHP